MKLRCRFIRKYLLGSDLFEEEYTLDEGYHRGLLFFQLLSFGVLLHESRFKCVEFSCLEKIFSQN